MPDEMPMGSDQFMGFSSPSGGGEGMFQQIADAIMPGMRDRLENDNVGDTVGAVFSEQLLEATERVREEYQQRIQESIDQQLQEGQIADDTATDLSSIFGGGLDLLLSVVERSAGQIADESELEVSLSIVAQQAETFERILDMQEQYAEGIITRAQFEEQNVALLQQFENNALRSMEAMDLTTEQIERQSVLLRGNTTVIDKFTDAVVDVDTNFMTLVDTMRDASKEVEEQVFRFEEGEGVLESLIKNTGEYESQLSSALGPVLGIERGIMGVVQSTKALAAAGGLLTVLFLLQQAASLFGRIDESTRNLADNTGLSRDRLNELQSVGVGVNEEFAKFGLNLDDALNSVVALEETFGNIEQAVAVTGADSSEQLVSNVGRIAGDLRVGAEEAAEIFVAFDSIASITGEVTSDLLIATRELAQQANVAPQAVFQDIAQNAENVAIFSGNSAEEISRAAVEARRLGTNLGDVLQLQEQFLTDIGGTVSQIQQTAVFVDAQLDPTRLLSSAAEGTEQFLDELTQQFGDIDLEDLNPFQRMQLRELGIPLETIDRMQRIEEISDGISRTDLMQGIRSGDISFEDAFEASATATQLEQMRREFGAIGATLVQDIFPPLMQIANVILPPIATFLQGIGTTISFIADMVGVVVEGFNALVGRTGETEENVGMIAGFSENITFAFGALAPILAGIALSSAKIRAAFTGFSFSNIFGGSETARAASTVSQSTGGISRAMSRINPAQILSVAAGMLALAGSVFVLSEAAKRFQEAGLEGTLLMAGAVGTLIAATVGLAAIGPVSAVGIAALLGIAGAVFVFSEAAIRFAEASSIFMESIQGIADIDGQNLILVAGGIAAVGASLAAFGAGGFLSAFGAIAGLPAFAQIMALSERSDQIVDVANSIDLVADSLDRISNMDVQNIEAAFDTVGSASVSPELTQQITQMSGVPQIQAQRVVSEREMTERRIQSEIREIRERGGMTEGQLEALKEAMGIEEIKEKLSGMVESQDALLQALRDGEIAIHMDGRKVSREHYMRNRNNQIN